MKKIGVSLVIICLLSFVSDNKILWEKSYDFPIYSAWINRILPYYNNGYIFIGNGEDGTDHPGIVAKLDNTGNMVWSKIFDNHHFENLILTKDEEIIIYGDTAGIPCIMKLEISGAVKWKKVYYYIDNREYKYKSYSDNFCVKELANGNFIAAITNRPRSNYLTESYVSYIFRTNSFGEIQWATSQVDSVETRISSIEVGYNNDYYLCDSRNDILRITITSHKGISAGFSNFSNVVDFNAAVDFKANIQT